MKLFKFFGEQEHRVFNYKPVYYDVEKEERRKKFGSKDDSQEYAPGNYLQGAFRDGAYQRTRNKSKAQKVIGLVGLILFIAVMFLMTKFYTLL